MNRKNGKVFNWGDTAYWILWGTAIALYLVWPLTHLEAYAWSNDEGLYVQRAALANAGYPLYRETFLNKPPLLIWILQLAFGLAGQSIAVARLTSLSLSLLGFVTLGAVAKRLWGRWAGLASVGLLLGLPEVPVRAHAVMSDLPAMTFALVSLWAALSFRYSGRRAWMALSGATYAGALLIHPLLFYMALPLAAVLFLPRMGQAPERPTRRTDWRDLAVFSSALLLPGLIALATIDRQAFFTWVVRYNIGASDSNVQLAASNVNWRYVTQYLGQRWTAVWLAVMSGAVLCTVTRSHYRFAIVITWFLATTITLLVWSPVWDHYLLFLVLPLIVVAGGGIATVGKWIVRAQEGQPRHLSGGHKALVIMMLLGLAVFLVERWGEPMPQPEGGPEWSPDRLAARAFLTATVTPHGFVVTDDPLLAFSAGRLVPPALTGASYKRIRSGYLAQEDLVLSTLRYHSQAVLFATGRLSLFPGFEAWVVAWAAERQDFGPIRGYRLDLAYSAPHLNTSHLGDAIVLEGYSLSTNDLRPGDTLTVTLYWRARAPVAEDYTVFVHLIDEEDHMWGQHDGPPLMNILPTSQWTEALLLPDAHPIVIDPGIPPGAYRLLVGMYRWPSLERLPARRPDGERWLDDCILLTTIHVAALDGAGNSGSDPHICPAAGQWYNPRQYSPARRRI